MNPEPAPEHRWLQRLVGRWEAVAEGEDAPPPWTETVRPIGELWVACEGQGTDPKTGRPTTTIMTLGYELRRRTFVGSFIGSMMDDHWVYEAGTLDGDTLTLECEGPDFANEGGRTRFKDLIAFEGEDRRTLTGLMQGGDGAWNRLMMIRYRRIG